MQCQTSETIGPLRKTLKFWIFDANSIEPWDKEVFPPSHQAQSEQTLTTRGALG